jgi:hypothetical protein
VQLSNPHDLSMTKQSQRLGGFIHQNLNAKCIPKISNITQIISIRVSQQQSNKKQQNPNKKYSTKIPFYI